MKKSKGSTGIKKPAQNKQKGQVNMPPPVVGKVKKSSKY